MHKLRKTVYTIFSNTVMIALALFIIPVIFAQNFLLLTPTQKILVSIIDWIIWSGFLLEFISKLFVAEKRIKWLKDNWIDSIISIVIIVSPILEYVSAFFSAIPGLGLMRSSRLPRLIRLISLTGKVKYSWSRINLKVYTIFFFIVGLGFVSSFTATGFQHTALDVTWISVFANIFGVFYAVLVSFFVIHVWGKYNSISGEIGKQINALRNVYILGQQLLTSSFKNQFKSILVNYIDQAVTTLWNEQIYQEELNKKFLQLTNHFHKISVETKVDEIILTHIIEELRASSISQTNLVNSITDKTPTILWVLLLSLSIVLIGNFIFLGYQNQFVATVLITLVSSFVALIVALIFDIDTPLRAGFWSLSPKPYIELKQFIERN